MNPSAFRQVVVARRNVTQSNLSCGGRKLSIRFFTEFKLQCGHWMKDTRGHDAKLKPYYLCRECRAIFRAEQELQAKDPERGKHRSEVPDSASIHPKPPEES